jgi:uncharacterized RDD family membrane protein YckC
MGEVLSTLASASVVPLYAGFWRRAAAICIDGLIVFLATALVSQVVSDGLMLRVLAVVLACAYYAGCHSSAWQATLGKRIYGIKVTDDQGRRISLARAIARYFATWLSGVLLGIGFLMAAFSHKRQALHDMLCGTLVVNRDAQPSEVVAGGGVMPVTVGIWIFLVLLLLSPFVAGLLSAIWMPAYRDYKSRARMVDATDARHVMLATVTSHPPLRVDSIERPVV